MVETSLLARLARDTAVHHAEADADVDRFLFGNRTTVDDYHAYLVGQYGFLAPLETALATAPGLEGVIDMRARSKAALIAQDLAALGTPPSRLGRLPQCITIPAFRGPAAALGWLYVAERPMLAAAVIGRHVATRLPFEVARAGAYLNGYDGQVAPRWRELGDAMDRIAATQAIADRIVLAAHEAFRALRRWRTREVESMRLAV